MSFDFYYSYNSSLKSNESNKKTLLKEKKKTNAWLYRLHLYCGTTKPGNKLFFDVEIVNVKVN